MLDDRDQPLLAACIERARGGAFYAKRLAAVADAQQFACAPLTRKSDLRSVGAAAFIAVEPSELFQYHETFGTTGRAAGSWFTRRDYANDLQRVQHWSAPFGGQRVLVRFPYALSMPAHLVQRAVEQRGGAIIAASSRNSVCTHVRAVRLIDELALGVLACSPFEALLLAEAAKRLGLRRPSMRAICVAGELLSDEYRALVEDAWGAPVSNLYGSTETGALATSCERNVLHACDGQLLEVLADEPPHGRCAAGELGLIVVTTLDREAMPLIRYVTGDYGRWFPPSACRCGRKGIVVEPVGRFRTKRREYATERDVLDLACRIARRSAARFFAAALTPDRIDIEIESEAPPAPDTSAGADVSVRHVAPGTLVDSSQLLAECTARKPRLVRVMESTL